MYVIYRHFKRFGFIHKPIYYFSIVTFFYAVVNGITTFTFPLFVNDHIKSLSIAGIILGLSSVGNILTDLILGIIRKPPSYISLVKMVGFFTTLYFLLILIPTNIFILLIMALMWGIFTEIFSFARFDYVSCLSDIKDQALHHGLLSNFFSLGSMVAPLIAGVVIMQGWGFTVVTGLFFVVMMFFSLIIFVKLKMVVKPVSILNRRLTARTELKLWRKIGFKTLPLLVVFFVWGTAEGAILSFSPIFTEGNINLKLYSGMILAGFYLPTVFLSSYFGHLADKVGEKKFIVLGLVLGALSLLFFGYTNNFLLAFFLAILHGIGISCYGTAVSAEESKYIEKHHCQENRVLGETGIFYNFGFIIGAFVAGFLASKFGFGEAFFVFGMLYFAAVIIYWFWGPRKKSLIDGDVK